MRRRGWFLTKTNIPRGEGEFENEQGWTRGERGSKLGDLDWTYFLNVLYQPSFSGSSPLSSKIFGTPKWLNFRKVLPPFNKGRGGVVDSNYVLFANQPTAVSDSLSSVWTRSFRFLQVTAMVLLSAKLCKSDFVTHKNKSFIKMFPLLPWILPIYILHLVAWQLYNIISKFSNSKFTKLMQSHKKPWEKL